MFSGKLSRGLLLLVWLLVFLILDYGIVVLSEYNPALSCAMVTLILPLFLVLWVAVELYIFEPMRALCYKTRATYILSIIIRGVLLVMLVYVLYLAIANANPSLVGYFVVRATPLLCMFKGTPYESSALKLGFFIGILSAVLLVAFGLASLYLTLARRRGSL